MSTLSNVGVISGRHPVSTFESALNHLAYCERQGYTYVHCPWPTRATNPYMNKVQYLRHYLDLFDWVFWVDDDAFFLDMSRSLEEFLPGADEFLTICASPDNKSIHTYVSSGQFLMRCGEVAAQFLEAIAHADLEEIRRSWTDDLGFFTGGDQDAVVHLLKNDPRFAGYQRLHHTAFNSRPGELVGGQGEAFLVHFTGPPRQKRRDHRALSRALDLPPSLLPLEIDAQYVNRYRLPKLRAAAVRARGALRKRLTRR